MLGRESRRQKASATGGRRTPSNIWQAPCKSETWKFENFPVSVFRSAQSQDYDGLIGADVFQRFIVGIDFPNLKLLLDPRPQAEAASSDELEDAASEPATGFFRAMRYGNHLTIYTSANQRPLKLFLIDSGASLNLIDEDLAREAAPTFRDDRIGVRGIQGKVEKSSVAERVSVVFAGFRYDNRDLVAISFDKISESAGVGIAGILGLPVLKLGKLTIDYRNGTVRFEYQKQP